MLFLFFVAIAQSRNFLFQHKRGCRYSLPCRSCNRSIAKLPLPTNVSTHFVISIDGLQSLNRETSSSNIMERSIHRQTRWLQSLNRETSSSNSSVLMLAMYSAQLQSLNRETSSSNDKNAPTSPISLRVAIAQSRNFLFQHCQMNNLLKLLRGCNRSIAKLPLPTSYDVLFAILIDDSCNRSIAKLPLPTGGTMLNRNEDFKLQSLNRETSSSNSQP